jgi:hypothetical protein
MRDPLFLAHRAEGKGVVRDATIEVSKHSGYPFIKLTVDFGGLEDNVTAIMGRIGYTKYVIEWGLPSDPEFEEANVKSMIGKMAQVNWQHKKAPNNDETFYVTATLKDLY